MSNFLKEDYTIRESNDMIHISIINPDDTMSGIGCIIDGEVITADRYEDDINEYFSK